ncbi:hypothetical protein V6Z11_A12G023000 [Gossypium hirsutum]
MGVSPSQAKTKKGNHVFPEENTSEQGHEIEIATGVSCSSIHKSSSEYVANGSCPQPLRLLPKGVSEHNHTDQSFSAQETVPGKTHERHSGYVHKETSEKKHQPGSEIVKIKLEESRSWVCGLPAKHSKPFSKGLSKNAITEGLGLSPAGSKKDNIRREPSKPPEQGQQLELESLPNSKEQSTTAISTNVFNQALQLNPEDTNKSNCDKLLQSPSQGAHNVIQSGKIEDMAKNSCAEQHETTSKNFSQSKDGKTLKTIKKKYMLRSSTNNDRTLPSISQEKSKPGQLSNNLVDVASSEQGQRRKKKRREKREVVDEYSRIRGHLRYLLNRISYERSLIAVYSAEGWKGQSLEKLKPEKELQRATSEILRRKLKIKDLFKRIDSLCAEGRLPESLFDSEGQIDSEDFLPMMRVGYALDAIAKLIVFNCLMNFKEQVSLLLTIGRRSFLRHWYLKMEKIKILTSDYVQMILMIMTIILMVQKLVRKVREMSRVLMNPISLLHLKNGKFQLMLIRIWGSFHLMTQWVMMLIMILMDQIMILRQAGKAQVLILGLILRILVIC